MTKDKKVKYVQQNINKINIFIVLKKRKQIDI